MITLANIQKLFSFLPIQKGIVQGEGSTHLDLLADFHVGFWCPFVFILAESFYVLQHLNKSK